MSVLRKKVDVVLKVCSMKEFICHLKSVQWMCTFMHTVISDILLHSRTFTPTVYVMEVDIFGIVPIK